MTDFDEELTVTLRERARAVPPRRDLAGAAIRQAHGIRRRRRIAGAVATALVAVAVPVGLQAGDALSRGNAPVPPASQGPDREETVEITPSQVTLQLTELPAGDAPSVPYVDGSQLILDGEAIDLGVDPAEIGAVAYAGGVAYFTTNDEGTLTLRDTSPDDDPEPVITAGPWGSPDQRYVAYLAEGQLRVRDTTDGAVRSVAVGGADYLQSLTFAGDEVFFVAGNDFTLMRWTIGDAEATPVDGITRATAVSPDGELVADMYEVDDFEAGTCTQMKSVNTSEPLWETCDFRVLGFSPDGRYVWGANEYADGGGNTYNVVLDAQTGAVVMRVDGPRRANPPLFFGDSVFESDTTLLIDLGQGLTASLVRCDLTTGGCERATELAEGSLPFEEGGSPYRLLG